MQARFYHFAKRPNSTRRPVINVDSFDLYDIAVKTPCSILNPDIVLDTGNYTTRPNYNYIYIPEFGRWYFVTDTIVDGRLWTFRCKVDVLATFRATIGDWSGYVLRSAHESDGQISDGYYPGISKYSVNGQSSVTYSDTQHKSTPWAISVSSGCFVLGMQSQDGALGSIKYIALSPGNMQTLCASLASDTVTSAKGFDDIIASIGTAMTKQLVDPLQFIKTAMWIPLPYSTFSAAESTGLDCGYLSYSAITYKDISGQLWWGSLLAFPLNDHPQVSRGSYLNDQPYTERYLFAPPFGIIPIQAENIQGYDYIAVNYRVDFISGQADMTLFGTDDPQINNVNLTNNLICRAGGQVGVPITMTQAVTDYMGMLAGTMQALGGALMMSPADIGGGILNTLSSKYPRLLSKGGTGGIAGLSGTWRLYSVFTYIADEHLSDVGRPLCKIRQMSVIPGFIQVRSAATLEITGTAEEREQIRAYMEGGFFYE